MTASDLLARWRNRADLLDTAATAYNGKCLTTKGVQMTLRAKEVRKCADELEQSIHEKDRIAAASNSDNAFAGTVEDGGSRMEEGRTDAQARDVWPSP